MTQRPVLIVDDEDALLDVIVKGLESLQPSVAAYTARSVGEAIALLASRPFDVVITDLMMPGADGFELLAHMSRGFRRIPAIVMSGHLTPARREHVARLGGLWCFEKPVHLQVLSDAVGALLAAEPDSVVHGVSVAGFLQLLEIEKKTSTMTVRHGELVGRLFLQRGRLVDAECGASRGVEAAQRLVSVTDARIELTNVLASTLRTIDQSVGALLLDAFRSADEARQAPQPAAGSAVPMHLVMDPKLVSRELVSLEVLTGFMAAAVYSPKVGMIARQGDPGVVDNELCALVNASTGGLGELLAEREWGQVRDADFVSSHGWLLCLRSVPDCEGLALVVAFRKTSSIGLVQHHLREIVARLQRQCRPSG